VFRITGCYKPSTLLIKAGFKKFTELRTLRHKPKRLLQKATYE
jgi:hypothetical protein